MLSMRRSCLFRRRFCEIGPLAPFGVEYDAPSDFLRFPDLALLFSMLLPRGVCEFLFTLIIGRGDEPAYCSLVLVPGFFLQLTQIAEQQS